MTSKFYFTARKCPRKTPFKTEGGGQSFLTVAYLCLVGSQCCKQKAGVAFVFSLPFERLFWTNFQFSYILWKFAMFVESKRGYFIICKKKRASTGSADSN